MPGDDAAQEAHGNVLRFQGAWCPERRVVGRAPLPRSQVLGWLTIDDHACIARVGRAKGPQAPGFHEAEAAFLAGRHAYVATPGLHDNVGKACEAQSSATLLGAELDGVRG